MKINTALLVLSFLVLLPFVHALDISPTTEGNIAIDTTVVYDVSLEPATDALVYYTTVSGENVDCTVQTYRSDQVLEEVDPLNQPGTYKKIIDYPSEEGAYTICVKAEKPGFRTDYAGKTMMAGQATLMIILKLVLVRLTDFIFLVG